MTAHESHGVHSSVSHWRPVKAAAGGQAAGLSGAVRHRRAVHPQGAGQAQQERQRPRPQVGNPQRTAPAAGQLGRKSLDEQAAWPTRRELADDPARNADARLPRRGPARARRRPSPPTRRGCAAASGSPPRRARPAPPATPGGTPPCSVSAGDHQPTRRPLGSSWTGPGKPQAVGSDAGAPSSTRDCIAMVTTPQWPWRRLQVTSSRPSVATRRSPVSLAPGLLHLGAGPARRHDQRRPRQERRQHAERLGEGREQGRHHRFSELAAPERAMNPAHRDERLAGRSDKIGEPRVGTHAHGRRGRRRLQGGHHSRERRWQPQRAPYPEPRRRNQPRLARRSRGCRGSAPPQAPRPRPGPTPRPGPRPPPMPVPRRPRQPPARSGLPGRR